MRLYEYIDAFILDRADALNSEFRRADIAAWADEYSHDFDVGEALASHREHPHSRTFTTERIGMGPKSYYRVVETAKGVTPSAVMKMHRQQGQEMVDRWGKEYECRMKPIATRHVRARRVVEVAKQEMTSVALTLGARMRVLEEEQREEEDDPGGS